MVKKKFDIHTSITSLDLASKLEFSREARLVLVSLILCDLFHVFISDSFPDSYPRSGPNSGSEL